MKLEEHLKGARELIRDWGFFILAASLLNYAIFAGIVYKAPNVDKGDSSSIETDLNTYVDYFEKAAAAYRVPINMKNLTVKFVDSFPVETWVGLCESGIGVGKYVSIRRDYFKNAPMETKYTLMIHELGHCVLGKDHVEGYLTGGCPKSIMHPSDALFGCFFKNQDYYFRELFGLL